MFSNESAPLDEITVARALCFLLGAQSARERAMARNVSYTPNLTGKKHTISTLVDKTKSVYSPTQKKSVFSVSKLNVLTIQAFLRESGHKFDKCTSTKSFPYRCRCEIPKRVELFSSAAVGGKIDQLNPEDRGAEQCCTKTFWKSGRRNPILFQMKIC